MIWVGSGTAGIARKNWQAIALSGNAAVIAVASRTLGRSRQFIADGQAACPLPNEPAAVGSYDELLARWRRTAIAETRERVLVLVSRPEVSEELVRRGGRIAQRTQGDLLVAHLTTGEKPPDPVWIGSTRRLVADLGGEFEVLHDLQRLFQLLAMFRRFEDCSVKDFTASFAEGFCPV